MNDQSSVQQYGKYELIAHLATGGMAEIYLARQRGPAGFEKLMVIKRILPHLSHEDVFIQMFLDEARIAAQLNHPNVVQIFDLGRVQDQFFIAMEYLEGECLSEVIRKGRKAHKPLPANLAAGIALQMCEGLHYANTLIGPDGEPLQVVHRDINPQNVFVLYSGGVKLVDFGIAKAAKRFSHTTTGMLKGKYGYMSPEQIMNLPVDGRSDVYSCGVVLWEMLTGRRLFRQGTELEILKAITEQDVPPPSAITPGVPADLERIALQALKRSRDLRTQTAGEMRMELSFYLKQHSEQSDTVAIGEYMQSLFYDRMLEKRRSIKQAQSGQKATDGGLVRVLRARDDTEPSIARDTPTFSGEGVLGPTGAQVSVIQAPGQSWKWVVGLAAGALALAVVALVLVFWVLRGDAGSSREEGVPAGSGAPPAAAQPREMASAVPDAPRVEDQVVVQPAQAPEPVPIASKSRPPRRRFPARAGKPKALAKAPTRATGRLRLATSPWVEVYLKGRKLGATPIVDLELPAGKHVLRAVNQQKQIDREIAIEIKPGETTVKRIRF